MKRFLQDKRNLVISLLIILFLIALPKQEIRFLFWVITGVFLASTFDIFINKLFFNRSPPLLQWRAKIIPRSVGKLSQENFPTFYESESSRETSGFSPWGFIKTIIPKSAVITGLIVSGIIDYQQSFLVLVILSFLAIISKYLIKLKNKHIFNPACFALFLATIFKIPLTWSIESNIYLIVIIGLCVVYSLKKFPHVIGFMVLFNILFMTKGINPLNLISWFFVFVMLIEPKTSGYGTIRGFVSGGITAIFAFLIFKVFPQYDFFVCALFLANLFNPILDNINLSTAI